MSKETENEIYAVFTTQEEVGLRGSRTSSYRINLICLAVDVTLVGDTPEPPQLNVALGERGPLKLRMLQLFATRKLKQCCLNWQQNIVYRYNWK